MIRAKILNLLRGWLTPGRRAADRVAEQDYEEAVHAMEALKSLFEREMRQREQIGAAKRLVARDHR